MTYLLAANRPWLAAAILTSTIVLSACGGGGGADSLLDEKRPTSPKEEATEPAPNTDTPPSQGSHRPDAEVDNSIGGDNNPDLAAPPLGSGGDAEPGSPPTVAEPIEADGSVFLVWSPPTERENGEPLYDDDLGGYEIRYRQPDQEAYETITIENRLAEFYEFDNLVGTYHFQIAAYDTEGLYSKFVDIRPRE